VNLVGENANAAMLSRAARLPAAVNASRAVERYSASFKTLRR
jgi:hypothetical protein